MSAARPWVRNARHPARDTTVSRSLYFSVSRFERHDGVAHVRIEARAAGVEMGEDCGSPPRIPEFPDVLGNCRYRLVVALALEELADLIGHVDQPVRRHGRLLARRSRTRC